MHMAKRTQILVIGHNESGCTQNHEKIAYDTGAKIAQSGAVLVTGGLGGVMRFSCSKRCRRNNVYYHRMDVVKKMNFVAW